MENSLTYPPRARIPRSIRFLDNNSIMFPKLDSLSLLIFLPLEVSDSFSRVFS